MPPRALRNLGETAFGTRRFDSLRFAVWSEIQGTARVTWAWRVQADAGFVSGVQLGTDVTADPAVNSIAQIAVDARGDERSHAVDQVAGTLR
jgi:hypothetical protein